VILSANNETDTVGVASSFTVKTAGFPTALLSENGALDGLAFTDNGNGTATLSGTPTAAGKFDITITAANGIAPDATQDFSIVVAQPGPPFLPIGVTMTDNFGGSLPTRGKTLLTVASRRVPSSPTRSRSPTTPAGRLPVCPSTR
jgi:hypothetical protein